MYPLLAGEIDYYESLNERNITNQRNEHVFERDHLIPSAVGTAVLNTYSPDRAPDIVLPSTVHRRLLSTGGRDNSGVSYLDRADDVADFYLSLGARIVALTMGRDGTLVATAERRQQMAPYPVEAVDATAAGDTFDGAFLAQYLRSKDPFEAADFANAAAALSTQGFGAVAPMPTRAQVDHFLATRAHDREQ